MTPGGALRNRIKGKAGASSGSGSKGEGRPRAAAGLAGSGDAVLGAEGRCVKRVACLHCFNIGWGGGGNQQQAATQPSERDEHPM